MSNTKKTLQMTSLLFGMILLFCYISWHLGYEGFIIIGHIEIPYIIQFIVSFFLLLINLSLQGGFVLDLYSWKIFKYTFPMTIIIAISSFILPGNTSGIFAGVLPMIVFLMLAFFRKTIKSTFIKILIINTAMLIHQFIVSQITYTPLTYDVSFYTIIRLSIDTIILKLLFYTIGGAKYYALERMVFPGRTRIDKNWDVSCQTEPQNACVVPIDKFEKWVMRSVIAAVQVMQWIFILWVCNLDNLFLDALVITASFICHGMIIAKRKHLKSIILCTLAATAMFYFAARFTISFHYSQFFPIFIGLLLAYTVYRISYQFEITANEKAKEDILRIKKLEHQMEKAWKQLDELS